MTFQRHLLFWSFALILAIAFAVILGDVLMPFVIGFVIAYFLDPVADRLERLGMARWQAAALILLAFITAIVLMMILILPSLGDQLAGFSQNVPGYVAALQAKVESLSGTWIGKMLGPRLAEIQRSLGQYLGQGVSFVTGFLASLWTGSRAILGVFGFILITPVVAFYMLLDWDRMVAMVDGWVPRAHVGTVRGLAREIDRAVAGFIRGQSLVCLILGLIYAGGLIIVGLNFGFLIGLGAGLISFIPFVGSIVGFILAMIVALFQFWPEWHMLLAVAGVFAVGQFIEGNILSPKLVGNSVGLHPVWLMFALFVAGAFFGFFGLLVAVPVAAAIGVLVRFALRRYLESPLYTSKSPHAPELPIESKAP